MTRGPHVLAAHADVLRTKVGAAFPGSRAVFRGHDLHKGDIKNLDWLSLCAFGIFGRHVPPEQLRLFNSVWVWTSYPDSRLWNNRVAALAGTTRSTPTLSLCAAQALSEAAIYGRGIEFRAVDFYNKTREILEGGVTLADHLEAFLKGGGRMAGFGRPIATADERVALSHALARELGLADGYHVRLALEIDAYFATTRPHLRINVAGLYSAFAADFGWTPREFGLFMFVTFQAGMHPCYLEAADKPPGAMFPVRCADVRYEGVPARTWPGG